MTAEVMEGDCLTVLPALPEAGFDSVCTDPPYGLQFMGKEWDKLWRNETEADAAYCERTKGELTSRARKLPDYSATDPRQMQRWHQDWCEAVLRVLKPGGYMLAFGGTRTFHRLACAIEDAGFEIRDCIMWVYGSGFPKGKGCLKPAWEPIILARKPGKKVLPLQIDACRVGTEERTYDLKGGENLNCLSRPGAGDSATAKGCGAYGVGAKQVSIGKKTVAGRWPANCLHDGSEEVLEAFAAYGESKSPKGTQKPGVGVLGVMNDDGWQPKARTFEGHDTGTAARFFYCAKASKQDRDEGCEGLGARERGGSRPHSADETGKFPDHDHRVRGGNNHPCVKPTALMRYLCRLITPPGGKILDPFAGSGSTGKAAVLEGFDFIGIEKDAGYCEIARQRIAAAQAELPLFAEVS